MSASVRTHVSHPNRSTDTQAALKSRILNCIVRLGAFKIERSLLKVTHARAIIVLTSLVVDPTYDSRYLNSSATAISWLSLTSFIARAPCCKLSCICSVFFVLSLRPTVAALFLKASSCSYAQLISFSSMATSSVNARSFSFLSGADTDADELLRAARGLLLSIALWVT